MMYSLVILGFLSLAGVYAIPAPINSNLCPDPTGMIGTCRNECFPGTRCANGWICCNNGCGTSCMPPVESCKNTQCPYGHKCVLKKVMCVKAPCHPIPTCVPDSSSVDTCKNKRCPYGQKCVLEKVQCVKAPCRPIPTCVPDSSSDLDLCPDPTGMIGTCRNECIPGYRCANGWICCKNGCGTSCMPPVESCKNKWCPYGQKCVLKKVMCVKAPCHPIPTCVPGFRSEPMKG